MNEYQKSRRPKRGHIIKVRLFESELTEIRKSKIAVAKFLRESALEKIGVIEDPIYLKVEREKLYQLSKIGTNINQIAYAVNQEIAGTGTYEKVKLLQLLISIDNQIRSISI